MAKKYTANSKISKEKAQIYGERIEFLMKINNGKITPSTVVEDARFQSSPLHNFFEWDDREASQKYRLQQARNLLECVLEVVVINDVKTEQRSFFNVKNVQKESIYVTIQTAVRTPSYRKQILERLISTLENATNLMKLFKEEEH
jgi:hypothetical protein